MTYQQRLKQIGEVHKAVIPNVYHYFRSQLPPPYGIWQEVGSVQYDANNTAAESAISGSTDYFTKEEFDPVVDGIMKAFRESKFLWRLESVQYEEETGLIHYEFVWEVL